MNHAPKLFRQGVVGMACFIINILLMWWLVASVGTGVLQATAICFITVNALGHHLSRALVFPGAGNAYSQSFVRFMLVMGLSLLTNLAAMALAVNWLGMPYLLASAAIAALFFIGNFVLHLNWTFR